MVLSRRAPLGLQLWLKPLPASESARLNGQLTELGAPQTKDPYLDWRAVDERWGEIEPILDDYLATYRRVGTTT